MLRSLDDRINQIENAKSIELYSGRPNPAFSEYYYTGAYTQGILRNTDLTKLAETNPSVAKAYYRSYGCEGNLEEMRYQFLEEKSRSSKKEKEVFPPLKIRYRVNKIEEYDKCRVRRIGGIDVEYLDFRKEITERKKGRIGEIYFANISVEYKYGNMPYGNDKEWWKLYDFKYSYEDYIRIRQEEMTVDVAFYEKDGKWNVFPDSIAGGWWFQVDYY